MKSLLVSLVVVWSVCSRAEEGEKQKPTVKPYPFNFCIVQGDRLDPDAEPYAAVHEGQQYRFCCKDCWSEFRADPKPFVEKFKKLLQEIQQAEQSKEGGN